MEPNELEPGLCYTVFFEKQIPIKFKFMETLPDGKILCQKENGERFDFNSLPQHLSIRKLYPGW
jgi:hypothetical protein